MTPGASTAELPRIDRMDFLYQIELFLSGISEADWWALIIILFTLGLLGHIGEKWADKQEKKEQKAKGFITPSKPDKPEGPGLYKRLDTWYRNNKKKAWSVPIILWIIVFMMGGD